MTPRVKNLVGIVFRKHGIICDLEISDELVITATSEDPLYRKITDIFPHCDIHDYGVRAAGAKMPLYWIRFSP